MTEAPQDNPKVRLSVLFWIGIVLLLVGSGPYFGIILLANLGLTSDPNPNPVVWAILAMCTFGQSVVLIVGGLVASFFKSRQARLAAALAAMVLVILLSIGLLFLWAQSIN